MKRLPATIIGFALAAIVVLGITCNTAPAAETSALKIDGKPVEIDKSKLINELLGGIFPSFDKLAIFGGIGLLLWNQYRGKKPTPTPPAPAENAIAVQGQLLDRLKPAELLNLNGLQIQGNGAVQFLQFFSTLFGGQISAVEAFLIKSDGSKIGPLHIDLKTQPVK